MSERYKEIRSSLSSLTINAAIAIGEAKKDAKEQIVELEGSSNLYDKWEVFNKKYLELDAKGRTVEAEALKEKFLKENS